MTLAGRVLWAIALVCAAVATVCGEIAAVTSWIPHAGAHGREPSTLGYVTYYCALVSLSALAWTIIASIARDVVSGR